MSIRYYFDGIDKDKHWKSFCSYVFKRTGKAKSGILTPHLTYLDISSILKEYSGVYIWKNIDEKGEILEFDTSEDLLIFKLTFN
jgi:hypothetical protein